VLDPARDDPARPDPARDGPLMAGSPSVAMLGTGIMGYPMARNLASAGLQVRAWNRTRERAEPLAGHGVTVTGTAAEAARGADIVVTMLTDAGAVIAAMTGDDGGLAAMTSPAIWLQMSTVGEDGTDRCAQLAADRGVDFVDGPVQGTRQPAEQGQLVVLASGPERLRERVQPVLDVVGQHTIWVGEAGAGTRLKLVTNTWALSLTEAAAESMALAEGLGLDPALLLEVVRGGPLDLPYLQAKGKLITERNFEPAFKLGLAAKDAGLVAESAARRDLDVPLVPLLRQRLGEGAREHGDEDVAATYLTSAPQAR
jgi:3-hydroxyisobutyrate dehydrogenase